MVLAPKKRARVARVLYRVCDVVDYDCAVCIPVVHWSKGFIAFLTCCIPYFKLDRRRLVEGNSLRKKSRSNLSPCQLPRSTPQA